MDEVRKAIARTLSDVNRAARDLAIEVGVPRLPRDQLAAVLAGAERVRQDLDGLLVGLLHFLDRQGAGG